MALESMIFTGIIVTACSGLSDPHCGPALEHGAMTLAHNNPYYQSIVGWEQRRQKNVEKYLRQHVMPNPHISAPILFVSRVALGQTQKIHIKSHYFLQVDKYSVGVSKRWDL